MVSCGAQRDGVRGVRPALVAVLPCPPPPPRTALELDPPNKRSHDHPDCLCGLGRMQPVVFECSAGYEAVGLARRLARHCDRCATLLSSPFLADDCRGVLPRVARAWWIGALGGSV